MTEMRADAFENGFFYADDNVDLSAEITTNNVVAYESAASDTPLKTESTDLSICKVSSMKKGSVYKLSIAPVENYDGYLTEGRLNIYFYVTSESIYRIWPFVYENGVLIEFYNDDQSLIQILNTEEKMINNGYLVCQREKLSDSLGENDTGTHKLIEVDGNQITSRMWNVAGNGNTHFYESFSWEFGKGLTAYKSGFGAERDILYLNNISIKGRK